MIGADARDDQRRRVGGGVLLFDDQEAVVAEEIAREFRGAGTVVAPKEVVGADAGKALQKIGERGEFRVARAALVERAVAKKGELATVIAEFIYLRVVQLDGPYQLRRTEKPSAAFPH